MDANDTRWEWVDRSGRFSPKYYAYYGPNEASEAIRRTFGERPDTLASILELGCGPDRRLSHLREHGLEGLHDVGINPDCFEVIADAYPGLAHCGMFHASAIEEIVEEFSPGWFDAVYSVETLQYVHPDDAWVFKAVVQSASDYVVIVGNEGDRSVPPEDRGVNDGEHDFLLHCHDWTAIFDLFGLERVVCKHSNRDTRHMFRRVD